MFAVVYRFEVVPEKSQAFEEAWRQLTLLFREEAGALGSRLHRGDDGFWAYARWPDRDTWALAELSEAATPWFAQMRAASTGIEVVLQGEIARDLLQD